jgi:hypothetical protein
VACIKEKTNASEFWRGNLKRPLGIDVSILLKWILKETGWDSVGWMYVYVYISVTECSSGTIQKLHILS